MSRTKLLVFGSSSLVGSHFVETYANKYEISALGRRNIFEGTGSLASFETLDIQNESMFKDAVRRSEAKFVINYAAETNVDGCETEKGNKEGHVYHTNVEAVRWLAETCRETGKTLFQISTDFVFDGTKGPYSEDDEAGPVRSEIGWYGYTKYLAERELMKALPSNHCIVRISYPYRANFKSKTDFARNLLDLYGKGKLFPLFADQLFSPTLIDDVSQAVDFLIGKDSLGVYHVASRYPTTPYEFASRLITAFFPAKNPSSVLMKGSVMESNSRGDRAPRPVTGGLKTDKIAQEGFTPKTVDEGIEELYRQFSKPHNQTEKR